MIHFLLTEHVLRMTAVGTLLKKPFSGFVKMAENK
jgi:hypothetical protein